MTDVLAVKEPVFEFIDISKIFPGVQALDHVGLEVYPGEVLALVGENGAGKSTLLKVMNGDYAPDGGSLKFRGEQVSFQSPAEAHALGVRVIYQEPEILADLTVAENIYMGELPTRLGSMVDWNRTYQLAQADLERLGVGDSISSQTKAGTLSTAQRQMLEIVRAVRTNASILALDEPTSSLSEADSAKLFDIVEQFRQAGVGIIYVSHRLPEVLKLADRIAVLRDGKLVAVRKRGETNESDLVSLMVGRELSELFEYRMTSREEVALKVEGLTTYRVADISFEVHKGEVVGLAGLVGAGRTDLAKALMGEDRLLAGKVYVNGKQVKIRNPKSAIRAGIGFTPEDRKKEALVMMRSVRENITMVILKGISRLRFVNRKEEKAIVDNLVRRLQIKTPGVEQEVGKLSGGNQQKVVLARWLALGPDVLVLDEPTRGVDVGAKAEIYKLIHELAASGIAVLFISSELPEVLGVSDRIIVMQDGFITGEMPAKGATEEAILRLAMASHLSQA
ncbi:MAG: sugar ABC transporter ATP-binding protein [Caldilineales bacterium]|nr:sugar ABC transporter ATP-binding protein [Caldilineales bacterium]